MGGRRHRLWLGGAIAAAFTSAAPAEKAARMAAPLPPFTGAYQPQTTDERGLWMMVDEVERKLRDSPFVVTDPALNAYVRAILCRAVGTERCSAVRVYVMRVPDFNATMLPNGAMQVWTGLLLRVCNEAELAAVLGHEFAHFEERHSLARFQLARRNTDIATWAGMMGGRTGSAVAISAIGGIFSYTRDQERAADIKSVGYLATSPYRVAAFADIWARLLDEDDATAAGRRQKSRRYRSAGFFASHPSSLERVSYLRTQAAQLPGTGIENAAEYRAALAAWWPRLIDDQIKRNDLAGTDYLLMRLAANGWTPDLLLARGDLYRARGNPRDLMTAAGFYRQAMAMGGTAPELWRGLGLALLRGSDPAEGKAALTSYLAKRPGAADAALITALVE